MGTDLVSDFLTQLEPRVVEVRVRLSHGSTVEIKIATLSMHEWDELGESVKDPIPPFVSHNARGEEIRNYYDPTYLAQRRQVEVTRSYKRLTMGLIRGGNEIAGILFEDKVAEVQKRLDLAIAAALMRWQSALVTEGRVAVLTAADRFPAVEETTPEGPDEGEAIARAVAVIN